MKPAMPKYDWRKKVEPQKPGPLSFVQLVTKHGDYWASYLPHAIKRDFEAAGSDAIDYAVMVLCEEGAFSRVDTIDVYNGECLARQESA